MDKKTVNKIKEDFEGEGIFDFGDEEIELMLPSPPQKPDFPFFIFGIALFKDFADLLNLGIFSTFILSPILTVIMVVWTMKRLSGGWWKKRIISKIWIRFIATHLIEFIPILSIAPAHTIFILMAYNHEMKIVKIINAALEKYREEIEKFMKTPL